MQYTTCRLETITIEAIYTIIAIYMYMYNETAPCVQVYIHRLISYKYFNKHNYVDTCIIMFVRPGAHLELAGGG